MTKFTVDITGAAKLAGITAARLARNNSIPAEVDSGAVDDKDQPVMVPNPAIFATDQDYVQFVMNGAAESYAGTYETDPVKIDEQIVELQAKSAEIKSAEIKGA